MKRSLGVCVNNITKIQGLNFFHELQKSDLMLSLIDLDKIPGIHTTTSPNLLKYYLLGNPCFHD